MSIFLSKHGFAHRRYKNRPEVFNLINPGRKVDAKAVLQ